MTKTRFLALITALALLIAIPTSVLAQRLPPNQFVGTVTLDGATAADGAAVTAWIDDAQVGSTTVSGGEYSLEVDQYDSGDEDSSYAGKTISFKVSGANAAETAVWTTGAADILNLVATTGTPAVGGGEGSEGATGPAGPVGPAGSEGPAGPAGSTGSSGSAGTDGSDGDDGAAGATGSAGPAGSAGAAGTVGAAGDDGSGGVLGVIALIVAGVALIGAAGAMMMGRRT